VQTKRFWSFLCYINCMQTDITCLGFIMDGNRRWAKAQGLPTLAGHERGHEVFKNFVRYIRDAHIPHAVFYAFSTENWNRAKEEVKYLMGLLESILREVLRDLERDKVRVRIIGRRGDLSPELQKLANELEEKSARYETTTIWVALSYGGRAEIVEAVNRAVASGQTVTEDSFNELLWTADMPDPDMIVRTSGEQRLSNFVTWKAVYSELYFIDKHWPALTEADFKDIIDEYAKRERRKGK
jgi:undecaprenyl diphosphate synthase